MGCALAKPIIFASASALGFASAQPTGSASDQRAKGNPRRDGNSQASALISTITLGGKASWSPAARLLFKTG
jgi:hypothetical protein